MQAWKKAAIGAGVLALAGIAAGVAAAQPHGRFFKHMVAARVEEAEDLIEATPQQRQAIDQAKDAILATVEKHRADHQGEREQWISLLSGDTLSEKQVVDAAGRKADELRAVAQEIAPQLVKVHDVLTPAQRQKLAVKARAMHGGHRGGHRGFGGPDDEGGK
ncbi:MAG: hypothetical protein NVS4B10_06490 [Myxococcales bacterium]